MIVPCGFSQILFPLLYLANPNFCLLGDLTSPAVWALRVSIPHMPLSETPNPSAYTDGVPAPPAALRAPCRKGLAQIFLSKHWWINGHQVTSVYSFIESL